MNQIDSAIAFLEQRANEDEQWALAASAPYLYAVGNPQVDPNGAEWTWAVGENWTPVTVDPAVHEFVNDAGPVDEYSAVLMSKQTWESRYVGEMHNSYGHVEEMDASAAGHIVRHDPRRVMQDVKASRAMIELYRRTAQYPRTHQAHATMIMLFARRAGWQES